MLKQLRRIQKLTKNFLTATGSKVRQSLIVVSVVCLISAAISTSLCIGTFAEDREKIGRGHSTLLIKEAFLEDLSSQIKRGILYAKESKMQVEKEETELRSLNVIVEDLDALFMNKGLTTDRDLNYKEIEEKLQKGHRISEDILKSLRDRFREKNPWFKPSLQKSDSDAERKTKVFKKGVLNRYFYGTRMPAKYQTETIEKITGSIEPFQFDFLEYGYNAKKVNQQEGKYNWKTLDKGMTMLKKYEYPLDISVNFGTMQPWPLMKEFSWIPGKYSESEIKEMLFQNDRGEVLQRSGFHSVLNIWHPVILEHQRNWIKALGRYCQNHYVAIYELFNEMGLSTNGRPVGYSKYARISFGNYLKQKYGDISTLNKKWDTSYHDLMEIRPLSGDGYKKENAPIGFIYEFERFRKESLVSYMKDMIAELKKADPNPRHAISSQFTGWFNDSNNPKMSARDFLMLASLDWDLYGVHSAGDGKFPAINLLYHYCINRYAKKIYWNDEFWWDYREAADEKIGDESILRAVAERNMWRHIAYGIKGFNIFPGIYSSESEPGGILTKTKQMRYATAAFPVVINKMNKHADIFFNAHLINQKIGILQPSTTLDIAASEFLANKNAMKLSDWILSEHIIPFYIPEECIIDGKENISEFKVLISPYAPYVPRGFSEKIKKWIENGGIFISIGPFGSFDQDGKKQEIFSKTLPANVGFESVVSQKYGKGKLICLEKNISYSNYLKYIKQELESFRIVSSDVKPEILAILARQDKYTGERNFYAKNDLDLVPWEDKKGGKYLFVINLNPRKRLEPKITVKGEFNEVLDLAIEGGLPVPAMTKTGFTEFSTYLNPGQGIIYKLN